MVGESVVAGLSMSMAIEALRLLNDIFSNMDIVADNGKQVLCAFPASYALHDRLCAFAADAENDEDPEGCDEECHRASPREAPPRLSAVTGGAPASWPIGGGVGLMTPTMMAASATRAPYAG